MNKLTFFSQIPYKLSIRNMSTVAPTAQINTLARNNPIHVQSVPYSTIEQQINHASQNPKLAAVLATMRRNIEDHKNRKQHTQPISVDTISDALSWAEESFKHSVY